MHYLEEIDFPCFFMATKNILGDLVLGLNPYTQKFFKLNNLYVALSHQKEQENLHVDMMAGSGGIQLFEQIRITALNLGCKTISMNTSENNTKVNKLAKFYKFREITRIPDFYTDGSTGIVYLKELKNLAL